MKTLSSYKYRLQKSATKSCQHVKIHCSLFLYIKIGVNSKWSFISKNLNVSSNPPKKPI